MKLAISVVTLLALVMSAEQASAQSAPADDTCQKTEYAELKDTPKDHLLSTYCQYQDFGDIEHRGFNKLADLYQKYGEQYILDDANKHRLQAAQCWDEATRIVGVLDRVYHTPRPTKADCDARFEALKAQPDAKKQETEKH